MSKIDYKKVYYQLLKEHPHNIEAFEKLANYYRVEFETIIKEKAWNGEEKAKLLRAFGYNTEEQQLLDEKKNYHCNAICQCLKENNETGFKALVLTFFDVENHNDDGYISKEEAYQNIIKYIMNWTEPKEKRAEYIDYLLENSPEEWLEKMFVPSYGGHYIRYIKDKNPITAILEAGDINVVKKYLHRVSNISLYLSNAVETGNKEIVQYFLDNGADINYIVEEPILGILTSLKMAIKNNDYEMYQFLIENGADPNLRIIEPNFKQKVINHKVEIQKDHWHQTVREEFEPKLSDHANELMYIRITSPLEYAATIGGIKFLGIGSGIDLYYGKSGYNCETYVETDRNEPSIEVINRQKIIDDLYTRLSTEELEKVDYNMLLQHSLLAYAGKSLVKYMKDTIRYNKKESINVEELTEIYRNTHRYDSLELDEFIKFIDEIDPEYNATKKLLEKCISVNRSSFYLDNFAETLLDKLSEEDKKKLCLMPYCGYLETCKKLIEKGFDINQANEQGNTLLIKLMSDYLDEEEKRLAEYVVQNADVSIKNKENKTALFYAIKRFITRDEYCEIRSGRKTEPTFLEQLAVKIVQRMNKKDVRNKSITAVLDWRHGKEDSSVSSCDVDVWERIRPELAYTGHRALFGALREKGAIFSKDLLRKMITELKEEEYQAFIDKPATKDFVFGTLDHNTEIHSENMTTESSNTIEKFKSMNSRNDNYAQIKDIMTAYNEKVGIAKNFRDNTLPKKTNPDLYLEYVKGKYGIDYSTIDEDGIRVLISALKRCKSIEEKSEILGISTNIDISATMDHKQIDMSYWEYVNQIHDVYGEDEDGNLLYSEDHFDAENVRYDWDEMILLVGGLMQYAILTDDIPLVQLLQEKGLPIELIIEEDDEEYDVTFDYVNSHNMKAYIEQVTSKKKYEDLLNDEVDFYESLISEEKPIQKKKVPRTSKN